MQGMKKQVTRVASKALTILLCLIIVILVTIIASVVLTDFYGKNGILTLLLFYAGSALVFTLIGVAIAGLW